MKNLLLSILIILGITSCSKDSLDPGLDRIIQPSKSEIKISVNYLHWNDQCEFSSGNSGGETLSFIENAKVEVYAGEQKGSDAVGNPLLNMVTNPEGLAVVEDLEPGIYTIWVDTRLGKKSRTVTTQLHKRSYIDFSF